MSTDTAIDEKVIVFEPKDSVPSYKVLENMITALQSQHADLLASQLRLFPYLESGQFGSWAYHKAGLTYTCGEKDNPLSSVPDLVERIKHTSVITWAVARVSRDHGNFSIAGPSDGDYIKFLELGLESSFEDLGAISPSEVRRFVINLDDKSFRRVVQPYLNAQGYKEILPVKVELKPIQF